MTSMPPSGMTKVRLGQVPLVDFQKGGDMRRIAESAQTIDGRRCDILVVNQSQQLRGRRGGSSRAQQFQGRAAKRAVRIQGIASFQERCLPVRAGMRRQGIDKSRRAREFGLFRREQSLDNDSGRGR